MNIRPATPGDIPDIDRLLYQVAAVHAAGRPDLFVMGEKKYTDDELLAIIENDSDTRPIFVYEDGGRVWGYAFCILEDHADAHVLTPIRTLYIDDLCVDENCRAQHIGSALYQFVLDFARQSGCYNVTLNVWTCNASAMAFYEKMDLKPQKIGMETIL